MSSVTKPVNLNTSEGPTAPAGFLFYAGERYVKFNVHGSVHRNNILIRIQQDATLHSLFYLETALHVSGGTSPIIRSANNCIYSIWY